LCFLFQDGDDGFGQKAAYRAFAEPIVLLVPAGVDPARRDAYGDRRGAVPCRMLEIQCGAPEIYSVLMNGFIALK
jgi:hypothetical protein